MRHSFKLDDETHTLWLGRREGHYVLDVAGVQHRVVITPDSDGRSQLTVDGATSDVLIATSGDTVYIHLDGRDWELTYVDAVNLHAGQAGGAADDVITAPMPGVVVAVHVAPGARVTRGDTLMVIESMKLETAIKAWRDGTIEKVHVPEGATFERSVALVTFAAETAG